MQTIQKEHVVKAVINKFNAEDDDLKFQTRLLDGYEDPGKIAIKGKESEGFVPDVVMEGSEKIDVFEVEMGKQYHPEKWRLFSLYSRKQKGQFRLVTPEQEASQMREFLDMNNISAKILYF